MSKRLFSLIFAMIMLTALPFALAEEETAFPASFDLRSVDTDGDGVGDRCYVTPVRAQYPFSTCWGFASTAAAETSILGSILKDDPDAWKTLNLSEKQLAFFAHYHLDDPASSQNGEGVYPIKFEGADDIYGGGSTYLATNTYAAGIGPTYESRDEALAYRGRELDLTLSVPGFEDRPLSFFAPRWELAGGEAACAELTVLGDGAQAALTPVQAGSTWLFVHADGVGAAIIPVTVQ